MRRNFPRFVFTTMVLGCAIAPFMVAGCSRSAAKQNTSKVTTLELIPLPKDWQKGHVDAVSSDGTSALLTFFPKRGSQPQAWRKAVWTEGAGTKEVAENAIPADLKASADDKAEKAAKDQWSSAHQAAILAKLDGGREASAWATGMSSDKALVVGSTDSEVHHFGYSFVWRKGDQVFFLDPWVKKAGISLPAGLSSLEKAGGISADGTTILGGEAEIWRLRVPQKFDPNAATPPKEAGTPLQLSGTITDIKPHKLTVLVTAVTTPDGKTHPLSPARKKPIELLKGTTTPAGMKVGIHVVVRGTDGGPGKPLRAQAVHKE